MNVINSFSSFFYFSFLFFSFFLQISVNANNKAQSTPPETPKPPPSIIVNPLNNVALFNALTIKIQALQSHYMELQNVNKLFSCYFRNCGKSYDCYSPVCKKRLRLRLELLDLLHKAHALNQANKENKVVSVPSSPKKILKSEGE